MLVGLQSRRGQMPGSPVQLVIERAAQAVKHRAQQLVQPGECQFLLSVGSWLQGISVAGSGVSVAAHPFAAAAHRGGTLTEVSNLLPDRDPVHAYDVMGTPALAAV